MARVGQGARQREVGDQVKEAVDGQIIEEFEGCDKDFTRGRWKQIEMT